MRILRWIGISAVVLFGVLALSLWGLYRASQSVPDFYEQALQHDPQQNDAAGDELEQQVVELHNELEQGEDWQLVLTDDQVNGWLASDLEEKFPGLLPRDVEQPRVAFRDGMTFIACRLNTPRLKTVLSFQVEAYLTEEPNEVAIRIGQARAGLLPMPLKRFLDQVRDAATRSDVALRWAQSDGDPVALVRVPTDHEELQPGVLIESMRVEEGKIVVSGTANSQNDFGELTTKSAQLPWRLVEDGLKVNRQP